jgi:hypothetical protein
MLLYLAFSFRHFLLTRYRINRSRLSGYQHVLWNGNGKAKILEVWTDRLSRNIGAELAFYAA